MIANYGQDGRGDRSSRGKLMQSDLSCIDNVDRPSAVDNMRSDIMTRSSSSSEYDIISSKALSIVSYFVGIDCTESAILSDGLSHRWAIQLTRETVLRHKSALNGIARLVADDPVVNAYLQEASKVRSKSESYCGELANEVRSPEMISRRRSRSRDFMASSTQQPDLNRSMLHCDPTK